MKSIIKYCFLPSVFYFLLSSCDKVKNPYVNSHNSADGCPVPVFPAKTYIRKILVEDYSGHRCIFCPSAEATLENICSIYPQQVIGITVHAGQVAEPSPCLVAPSGVPADAYYHYLGCPAGENYFTAFGFSTWPNGMVNRISTGGTPILGQGSWKNSVDNIVANPPVADINIFTNYDNSARKLCVSCKTTFLKSMTGIYNLSVLFVEDSIFDWQAFSGGDSSNYLFRFVLRDDINGAGTGFGEQIATGAISVNDTVVKSYSYIIPSGYEFTSSVCTSKPIAASPCNYKHCYVLAFVYDANSASLTYRQILQPEIKKIYP